MVFQLIKRDPYRWMIPFMTLVTLIASPIVAARANVLAIVYFQMIYCGIALGASWIWVGRRATLFEMGLPISGRQLFLARNMLLLIALWLPLIAGFGSTLLFCGFSIARLAVIAFESMSVATLIAVCLLCVRPNQMRIPGWLVLLPQWLALSATFPVWQSRFGAAGAAWIVAVCMALNAVVLAWVWRKVPRSYQLAPAAVGAGHARPARAQAYAGEPLRRKAPFNWTWMPVFRSVYVWYGAVISLTLPLWASTPKGIVAGCALLLIWMGSRPQTRWLTALPVHPRVVLAFLAGPPLALLTAGFLLGGGWVRHNPHAQVFSLALLLGWGLLAMLIMALSDWRPLGLVPRWGRTVAVFALALVPIYAAML